MVPCNYFRAEMEYPDIRPYAMRVIIFEDHGYWYGQCLEHDILARGDNIEAMLENLALTIDAEGAMRVPDGLSGIAPAPAEYQRLWAETLH